MITPLDALYIALATYSISYMITQTGGPFDVFSRIREGSPDWLRRLLTCYYCLAVWIALILMLIYLSEVGRAAVFLFAVIGAAYVVHRVAK